MTILAISSRVRQSLIAFSLVAGFTGSMNTPASAAVIVGTAMGSVDCDPFFCNESGTSSGQSIDYMQEYSASAFPGPLSIGSVTFYDTIIPGPILSGDYTITIGITSQPLGSTYPLTMASTAAFFSGHLGGPIGSSFTITGNSYAYDPSAGNLVIDIVAANQPVVPNGPNIGYFDTDYSGTYTTRSVHITSLDPFHDSVGLVTGFDVANVPLPGSFPLFGAALFGLGALGFGRMRKGSATVALSQLLE